MFNKIVFSLLLLSLASCDKKINNVEKSSKTKTVSQTSLVILGTAQDAGYPQIGCTKSCCVDKWDDVNPTQVTSIGVIEPKEKKTYLFEATPDIKFQIKKLSSYIDNNSIQLPNGIFLTHAHIGHYTGLMQLGREAINAKNIPVFTMPKMFQYLSSNGPWNQLVELGNIDLKTITNNTEVSISSHLKITPFIVPHRGEYTETVGYKIQGSNKTALFIPDIDKWEKWQISIEDEIKKVDYAFLDATFYKNGEIANRDMSEIPHPFVEESFKRFENMTIKDKSKIYFIHFNHTNPLLKNNSMAKNEVINLGFNIAKEGLIFDL
ncbi:MBL fold metallo-hydrolase [Winogradskyella jejuensis]|uniref:Pyrroloquinoline quinone biosynthesis protein B n=1 Tax=Winogradskyella jejuensis TaxID=1089305 RepID=A0A1M5SCZ1_9FLAO|nr:MBL fold metallo-hydrolase [Winogradskyella jejuensis]SHH36376.1 pyrroloquinoline quinone biosynthesis protein B [Winogradskyella jejuensis]